MSSQVRCGSTLCIVTRSRAEREDVVLRHPVREADGFVELYRRESEMVLVFCARRVLDAQVALDLTAETFAQAYKGRRVFRGTTEPEARAWLLTIARRQIARFLERSSTDRRLVERLGVQIPQLAADEIEDVERRAELPRLRALVGEELGRLSEEQRVALRLRIVEERSYEQIAGLLDLTEATVRARVSRGLRTLGVGLDARAASEGGAPWMNR